MGSNSGFRVPRLKQQLAPEALSWDAFGASLVKGLIAGSGTSLLVKLTSDLPARDVWLCGGLVVFAASPSPPRVQAVPPEYCSDMDSHAVVPPGVRPLLWHWPACVLCWRPSHY